MLCYFNDTIVKGKAHKEIVDATWDLRGLSAFHSNVSVALGTALQHLADSLFIQLANFILLRRDSYLEFVKTGLKPDTCNRLRNAPLFHSALFPDDVLASAKQDILKHESAPGAQGPGLGTTQHSGRKQSHYRYKPYDKKEPGKPVTPPSRRSLGDSFLTRVGVGDVGVEVVTPRFSLSPPAHNSSNDNYCVEAPQTKDFVEDQKLIDLTQSVSLNVVCHVPCATGPSQKKDISPFQLQKRIKSVKPVCCVGHCLCVQPVNSAHLAVKNPPVGGRLQLFWQVWLSLGANPRVVSILKEGYSLPFKIRPPLSRSPNI